MTCFVVSVCSTGSSLSTLYNPHMLQCTHTFCKFCLDKSLQVKHPKCPVCNAGTNRRHVTPNVMVCPAPHSYPGGLPHL